MKREERRGRHRIRRLLEESVYSLLFGVDEPSSLDSLVAIDQNKTCHICWSVCMSIIDDDPGQRWRYLP